jgi:hypothetical protein
MLISCAKRPRRKALGLRASGEVLMEPGGAPSELSLHTSRVSVQASIIVPQVKGSIRGAFAVLLTCIFEMQVSKQRAEFSAG